jgi:hypothetical protein
MRFSNDLSVLILAACFFGATSCSDDGDRAAESNPLRPQAGAAGSGGAAGTGGAVAGRGGGSADAGAPAVAGVGGSAGDGDSGVAPEPDPGAPDAGAEPPGEEAPLAEAAAAVGFSNVFTILQVNCGACHGMPGSFLPAFAQDDEDASYEVTQEPSNNGDDLYYQRIVARAVDERTMPPGCFGGDLGTVGCLSEEDAALLQAWAARGALP